MCCVYKIMKGIDKLRSDGMKDTRGGEREFQFTKL